MADSRYADLPPTTPPLADDDLIAISKAGSAGSESIRYDELRDQILPPQVDAVTDPSRPPLGSDLVTNGSFNTNLAGWTVGANWAWGAGNAVHSPGSVETLQQSGINLIAGEQYIVTNQIENRTVGTFEVTLEGQVVVGDRTPGGSNANTTNGKREMVITAISTGPADLIIIPTTDWDGEIMYISVEQLLSPAVAGITVEDENGTIILEVHGNDTSSVYLGNGAGQWDAGGNWNVSVGSNCMSGVSSGVGNTAVGAQCCSQLTTGWYVTGYGYRCLETATGVTNATAYGALACLSLTTGIRNAAFGYGSLASCTDGNDNSAFGYSAARTRNASWVAAFGAYAAYSNEQEGVTALGGEAGKENTTGDECTYVGFRAGRDNVVGDSFTTVGAYAGFQNLADNNTYIGRRAGYSADELTSSNNVAIGMQAMYAGECSTSVFIGSFCGLNAVGASNVMVGYFAGYYAQGDANVFIGTQAGNPGVARSGVDQNTIVGTSAGGALGDNSVGNVFLGYRAGDLETGSNKLYIANTDGAPLIGGDFAAGTIELNGTVAMPDGNAYGIPATADADAPNNSIYYSTDLSALVYKDSNGLISIVTMAPAP